MRYRILFRSTELRVATVEAESESAARQCFIDFVWDTNDFVEGLSEEIIEITEIG